MSSERSWHEALHNCLVFHSRDWAADKRDAWLYGVIVGWEDEDNPGEDSEAFLDVAAKFEWSEESMARLRSQRKAYLKCIRWEKQ